MFFYGRGGRRARCLSRVRRDSSSAGVAPWAIRDPADQLHVERSGRPAHGRAPPAADLGAASFTVHPARMTRHSQEVLDVAIVLEPHDVVRHQADGDPSLTGATAWQRVGGTEYGRSREIARRRGGRISSAPVEVVVVEHDPRLAVATRLAPRIAEAKASFIATYPRSQARRVAGVDDRPLGQVPHLVLEEPEQRVGDDVVGLLVDAALGRHESQPHLLVVADSHARNEARVGGRPPSSRRSSPPRPMSPARGDPPGRAP